jgi:uncharacterized protein (TIGR02391 family)
MLREYVAINSLIRTLISEITEIYIEDAQTSSPDLSEIRKNILAKLWELREALPSEFDQKNLENSFKFISNLGDSDVENLGLGSLYLVSDVMEQVEIYYSNKSEPEFSNDIFDLLHPIIKENSYHHFLNGHYRDAILNAFIVVFDLIRQRTNLDLDGAKLAQTVYSPTSPLLIVSTMQTESGRSEQIGFMNLLVGAYASIRNPRAHSIEETPSKSLTAQNLVFASLLAKRIEESIEPSSDKPKKYP